MNSNKEVVSNVLGQLKSLNKDDTISRRLILQKLQKRAGTYLVQRLEDGKLSRDSSLFTNIPCFELKADDIVTCKFAQFKKCNYLMKSVKKVPNTIFSRYGSSAHFLTNIDNSQEFYYIDFSQINSEFKREHGGVNARFTIAPDGHLYILNPKNSDIEVEGVNFTILTQDVLEAKRLSGCLDCDCESVWDQPFICTDLTIDNVITTVVQELMGTTKRLTPDENPNLDSNQKSQTKE